MFAVPPCLVLPVNSFISQSFNFENYANSLTHNKGHALDCVLSHDVSLNHIDLLGFSVSDHKAVHS